MRCAEQRRSRQAAEIDVRLKRVVLPMIERNAAEVVLQIFGEVQGFLLLNGGASRGLYIRRHLADRHSDPLDWRRADDFDRRRFQLGGPIFGGTGRHTGKGNAKCDTCPR